MEIQVAYCPAAESIILHRGDGAIWSCQVACPSHTTVGELARTLASDANTSVFNQIIVQ